MANQDFAHQAITTIRTIGAVRTDFKMEVPFTGTLVEVTLTVGGFSSFSGPWNFDVKLDGALQSVNISIDGSDVTMQATGLSVAVTERQLLEPFITSLGGGGGSITGPIIVTYTFKPTAAVALANGDLFAITKAAGTPGSADYSLLKTALQTDIVNPAVAGLSWKQAVRVATTAAGTLATDFDNGSTVDGVTIATGDRILIKNQAAGAENGIYVVVASGAPTRATDADSAADILQASVYVSEGTANADKQFVLTNNAPITLGTTALVFTEFTSGGGLTGASTTEQLTGTESAKYATPDSVAALWEQGSDIASAGTISIGEGGYFNVTGTTTITDIDPATDKAGRIFELKFAASLTLTHGANLILPTGANISTAAGDVARFRSEGSDTVRCVAYTKADGSALVGTAGTAASTTEQLTGTDTTKFATADSVAALWEQGSDIASAGTISVGEGGFFNVTGTTTITDIDFATDKAGRKVWLKFAGILTLTHHATTLILPTGANIVTAAGDVACFVSEGSDNVRCVSYTRASGAALAGGSGISSGTSFPGSPSDNDLFYRTDRDLFYFYDGTRWLTVTLYREVMSAENAQPFSASATVGRWISWGAGDYDVWIDEIDARTYHANPTGANFWTGSFIKGTVAESESTIGSFVTSSDTTNNWANHKTTIGALLGTSNVYIRFAMVKSGSATSAYAHMAIRYRLVG